MLVVIVDKDTGSHEIHNGYFISGNLRSPFKLSPPIRTEVIYGALFSLTCQIFDLSDSFPSRLFEAGLSKTEMRKCLQEFPYYL